MALSIGIVGLPNVGKSTLFKALTRKSVLIANYPFATIDPSVGIVAVPDDRVDRLADLSKSKKKIPAAVEFVDIAGLVRGAAEGEGLGNQFLSHIREVSAIAEVVRIFEDPDITHVHNEINPLSDIEVINLELCMADLQTVTKRLESVEKEVRRGDKEALLEAAALAKIGQELQGGRLALEVELSDEEREALKSLNLLTLKPILYVLNRKSGSHNLDESKGEKWEALTDYLKKKDAPYVVVDAGVESEISEVAHEDKASFRQEFGVFDDGINTLIRKGYEILNLITFLTTGEDETRAWTIKRGSTAPEAGAAIHSDFRDKFIRAEVVESDKLLEAGSYAKAREKGWVRTEGKGYVVEDGDVVEFKI